MYLFGASGHGKVVAEAAESAGISILGFIDENPFLTKVWNYQVLNTLPSDVQKILISVGNNVTRKKIVSRFPNFKFEKIIHSFSSFSIRSEIGEGTVVLSGVSVNSGVKIGNHSILNTNSSVDHDCQLSDFVHISPNAALAGDVTVGEGTHIGMGACVIQGINIGKWAIIGAGAVIIQDVPDYAVVVGNPGRIIKYTEHKN